MRNHLSEVGQGRGASFQLQVGASTPDIALIIGGVDIDCFAEIGQCRKILLCLEVCRSTLTVIECAVGFELDRLSLFMIMTVNATFV